MIKMIKRENVGKKRRKRERETERQAPRFVGSPLAPRMLSSQAPRLLGTEAARLLGS